MTELTHNLDFEVKKKGQLNTLLYLVPKKSYQFTNQRDISVKNVFEWNVKFIQVIMNIHFHYVSDIEVRIKLIRQANP